MKKRMLCFLLTASLTVLPAFASFVDVQEETLVEVTTLLDALGIMQGVGDSQFQPDAQLTRAQFCKIAVTALGATNVDAYKNYTIFPDVKPTHWAAPYVNSTLRHPEVKDLKIVRGYADGTFRPDNTVTYAEACTMMIRMMGYTQEDVGLFWPRDYMAFATALGLFEGMGEVNASATMTRKDAARLVYQGLFATCKDKTRLIDNLIYDAVEDSMLLATTQTSPTLSAGKAVFYEAGNLVVRSVPDTLTADKIGAIGTIYLARSAPTTVLAMVEGRNMVKRVIVSGTPTQTSIPVKDDTVTPGYAAVFDNRKGALVSYLDVYQDIAVDSEIVCVYNDIGHLKMLILF